LCLVAAVFFSSGATFGSGRGVVTRDPASGAVYIEFEVYSSFFMEFVNSGGNIKWMWTKTAITAVCVCTSYYSFFLGGYDDLEASNCGAVKSHGSAAPDQEPGVARGQRRRPRLGLPS
jgi:hypothetical protein